MSCVQVSLHHVTNMRSALLQLRPEFSANLSPNLGEFDITHCLLIATNMYNG